MSSIEGISSVKNLLVENFSKMKKVRKNVDEGDRIEISNTSKAFAKLDKFLNLGRPDRLDMGDLNDQEKEEFLKMLATLLKEGVVGYEIIDVNGKPEKHYIVNEIGNERLYGKKLYKKPGYYKD